MHSRGRVSTPHKTWKTSNFNFNLRGIWFYLETMLWRTTPITWLGIIAAFFVFWKKDFLTAVNKLYIAYILLIGIMMFLMFSLLEGRDSAHYILLTYLSFDICTGIALLGLVDWLTKRWNENKPWLANLVFGILMGVQAIFAFSFYPYYYNYYSPIMEAMQPGAQNGNLGYGEGLDLAAEYLNQKSDSRSLTVLAYWGDGPFSYFFDGRTIMLVNNYYKPELKEELLADLKRSDYLVIYYQMQKNMVRILNVVDALEPYPPEHVIRMNGIEYIRIYKIKTFPRNSLTSLRKSIARIDLIPRQFSDHPASATGR